MDVDELMAKAWGAVQKAGIPEPVQGVALKEAIAYLTGSDGVSPNPDRPKPKVRKAASRRSAPSPAPEEPDSVPDADEFYEQLAAESGVDEAVLRDVLHLKGNVIHVIPPTRLLGDSKAVQTRQVVALVAGAYAHGLGISPVSAVAVRDEVKRKRCFDPANFAARLKSMKGFSQGANRNEILVGSKWLGEFQEAINAAAGQTEPDEK